jgi:O-acetylhomoserine/O-acetylserine sulfhydrylase-like pyridoxal-dependent enzyme
MKYAEMFGPAAFAYKMRIEVQRDLGACLSPFQSWLNILGRASLPFHGHP